MGWRESRLRRAGALVSKYGLRIGLRDAVARWARARMKVPHDVLGDYGWVLNHDRPAACKAPGSSPLTINWLVPDINWGSGGLFNIFRAIYHLEQWGHKQHIYVLKAVASKSSDMAEAVRKKYFPVRSPIEMFPGEVCDCDALVATSFFTAYPARGLGNTAQKFYFIQDLEHLFYPPGSLFEFAKQTYSWGFYGITAGSWIAEVLSREFGMACSSFGFSFDRETYSAHGSRRLPEGKKRVLFYARPQTERRGFELGILALALVARKMPETEFVLVGLPDQPMRLPFSAQLVGILPPSDLAALYRSCDAALVLSHTNLSLLPLELMACGCPVVSNAGPNVEWLLTAETAQLSSPSPDALAEAVLALLQDESLRARKVAAGLALAQSTDWITESKKIEAALRRGLELASGGARRA